MCTHIEGWGSPSCIQSVMEKTGKDNRKVGKIGRIISQMPTLGLEDDESQARWASNILLENILEKV